MDYMRNLKESFRQLKWYEWSMIAIMVAVAGYAMTEAFIDPSRPETPHG
jgi:hypothetical protein